MSRRNKNTPGGGASLDNGGAAVATEILSQIAPLSSPTIRRRLSPQVGALIKLDICEQRLQAARAHGDEVRFSRYYLAWCRLHSLAFSYGRFAKEGSDV